MEKNRSNKDAARIHPLAILTLVVGERKSGGLFQIRVREGEKERNPPIILEEKVDERIQTTFV